MTDKIPGVWITYQAHPGGSQLDQMPDVYSGVMISFDELRALRYANAHGLRAIWVEDGQSLEQAIKARRGT